MAVSIRGQKNLGWIELVYTQKLLEMLPHYTHIYSTGPKDASAIGPRVQYIAKHLFVRSHIYNQHMHPSISGQNLQLFPKQTSDLNALLTVSPVPNTITSYSSSMLYYSGSPVFSQISAAKKYASRCWCNKIFNQNQSVVLSAPKANSLQTVIAQTILYVSQMITDCGATGENNQRWPWPRHELQRCGYIRQII